MTTLIQSYEDAVLEKLLRCNYIFCSDKDLKKKWQITSQLPPNTELQYWLWVFSSWDCYLFHYISRWSSITLSFAVCADAIEHYNSFSPFWHDASVLWNEMLRWRLLLCLRTLKYYSSLKTLRWSIFSLVRLFLLLLLSLTQLLCHITLFIAVTSQKLATELQQQ